MIREDTTREGNNGMTKQISYFTITMVICLIYSMSK
ncbi:hypothetical protein Golax_009904 [Gossypium laxum]|uniref:Uncharacterized protein n=1 Tax=Gossypium laxum TaxID=34288 RepID=A0A7J8ZFK3_9ROSI|nr:hypothetical protein [Gossypium laxum]